MKSSLPSVLSLFLLYSNASCCLTLDYGKFKAVKCMSGEQTVRTPRVRVLIRVAAAFYPQFVPMSMIFIGGAEYLPVILLPHLTGGGHL